MRFSAKYLPTTLFSLKDSQSTNSGAKTLFLPSSYSIKMAILNQAITVGGELKNLEEKNSLHFQFIRDAKISYLIEEDCFFSVTNSFVKILKPARESSGFQQTVAFREYLYISKPIEIIFEVKDELIAKYLKKYLHKINYFGKKGSFFQFLKYSDSPRDENVKEFDSDSMTTGLLQEYDDFDDKVTFEQVNNYSSKTTKRKKQILALPLEWKSSSKSFTIYKKK